MFRIPPNLLRKTQASRKAYRMLKRHLTHAKKGYQGDQETYERVLSFISHQENYLRLQSDTTCTHFRMAKMKNTGGTKYTRPSVSAVLHPWIQPVTDQKCSMIFS